MLASATVETPQEIAFYAGVLYPPRLFKAAAPVPAKLLHCALFRVADKRVARERFVERAFIVSSGGRFEYEGPELRQAEAAVFAVLTHELAGKGTEHPLDLDPEDVIAALGWSNSSHSHKKLVECLDRLTGAKLRAFNEAGEWMWSTGLVQSAKRLDDGRLRVRMGEELRAEAWRFFSSTTHLNTAILRALPEGLASWLYGYIASNDCRVPFDLEDLRAFSGSATTDTSEWGKQVRAALKALAAAGAIKSFEASRGRVKVVK